MQPGALELVRDTSPSAGAAGGRGDWIERHARGVFRFVRALGAPRDVAEELTQEAFAVAWQKGKHGLPPAALGAFLRRAARLAWLELRRDRGREEAAITALALRAWEREVAGDGEELVAAARRCVERLRGRAAVAVQLAYGGGASRAQIAAATGLLPNGVKTLLARTRRWLAQCIGRHA